MKARVFGVDFTSAPRKAKPIVCAHARLEGPTVRVESIETLGDFAAFDALLRRPGPWIAGFDLPFGLPLEFVEHQRWSGDWGAIMARCAALSRAELRLLFDAYREARPVGSRYAHRVTDRPAGSSSPLKLVNPPVGLMLHEGATRIAAAGCHVPLLQRGDRKRVALETYPGLLARSIVRGSYKNDTKAMQTPEREAARVAIVKALAAGRHRFALKAPLTPALRRLAIEDASGDTLDAILCAVMAAWAITQPGWGLAKRAPRGEGWIVGASTIIAP